MLISLIIPVYNVEKYIEKCIKSCINQDKELINYEIIIINDGTKDNSMDIVNKYYNKYPKLIKIYSQENKGLSAARNFGLKMAVGDYIWFIDSDDWIAPCCLKKIHTKLTMENPDILALCGANIIEEKSIRRNFYQNEIPLTGKDAFNNMISPCAPFAIFKRVFLLKNNLYFFEGIYHEDSEFMPKAYYYANKVSFYNEIVYNVFPNPTSITRTINPKKAFDIIIVCKSLHLFSQNVSKECINHLHSLISMNLNTSLSLTYQMDKSNIQKLNNMICENSYLLDHLLKSTKIKYNLEYFLFKMFPNHYVQIYKCIQVFNK